MTLGLAGLLLTAIGAALAAVGYFYFAISFWLIVPGALLALVGLSLLDGAKEQLLSRFRHRIADSYDHGVVREDRPEDKPKC